MQLLGDEGTYKKVKYNPTSRVTTKVNKLLQELPDKSLIKQLRPQNPTSPKIYGLPKIHKPDWPLRPIVSQIDSPTYKLARHLSSVLSEFTGKTASHVRDSRHFIGLLADIRLREDELMVSFDVASLFTNVPVDETIKIIADLVSATDLLEVYMKGIELCLKSGYLVWHGEYYLQVDGVAMGSPIAPVTANIFMEWFEEKALETAPVRPRYWWRYVDDVFAIVSRDSLSELIGHLNKLHDKVEFTVERENEGVLPFLDVLVMRQSCGRLVTTVYRKPTHTDRYLRADSHHHPCHLSSVPRTLINRALSLCDPGYVHCELDHVKRVLESNGYNWRQCNRIVNASSRQRPAVVERLPIYLPYIKGVTDKIGHLVRRKYGIKTIFHPHMQLRSLVRSPKDKEPLNVPGVYMIPCSCGKNYIGETGRNISTRLTEHMRSMRKLDSRGSAVTEHSLSSGSTHYIRFDKVSVLAREKFFVPRKVREAIEIGRHPNFNRDTGWSVPPSWQTVLRTAQVVSVDETLESDVVSVVCNPTPNNNSGEDEGSLSPPLTAAPSSRATRALARSSRLAFRSSSP